jgi:D-beta-D-heptose 7-phosphate kinase/D-beta-D-heptose 1-phosphate adenosyltransferase
VLAVVTLALVAGAAYPEAAALANLAAGIVVRKVGNYAPSPDELRAAVNDQSGSE